ncbi:hypothetical protein NCS52_01557400 [Fusarium sp. LHS14.1]|nr:hypothetical protein NCS52_01557400 [Fusarium sp. LHS14.1]
MQHASTAESTPVHSKGLVLARLLTTNIQHAMDSKYWSAAEEPDWSLHLAPLKDNIQLVLDIGTGTGSWAITQFAETHPRSTVIGTDIAPIQLLRVPHNVQFELDDCNRDWTWSPRSFDYVRICNMAGNVKDWPRLFRTAGQSTRIRGFIESSEDSILSGSTILGCPLPRVLQVWNLSIVLAGIRSGRSFHVVECDQQVRSMVGVGIEVIRTDHSWISYSERLLHNLLDDLDGVFSFPAQQLGWNPERVTVFLRDVRKAILSHGRWLGFRRTVVVGKVPQPL